MKPSGNGFRFDFSRVWAAQIRSVGAPPLFPSGALELRLVVLGLG